MLSPGLRSLAATADRAGRPLALWRRPGGAVVEAVIGAHLGRRPVFAAGRSGFALARFVDAGDGAVEMIEADVVAAGDTVRFVATDGGLHDEPLTAAQAALLDGAPGGIRAGLGAPVPATTGEEAYHQLVARAVAAIAAGQFTKVVTSRAERRALPAGTDLLDLFERLAARYPAAFVALVTRPGQDAWLVATPETLLSWRDGTLRTMALAGTQALAEGVALAEVAWVDKLVEEQAIVCRDIRRAFASCGVTAFDERGPRTVRAANLVHLRSEFTIPDTTAETAARLLGALHPTAAVCGLPKAAAAAFLARFEGYDRSCYTGFLGPVGIAGGTDLYVNLRTSQIVGDTLYLYVGGGIVAGSDPAAEWAETVAKTNTVGAVLGG